MPTTYYETINGEILGEQTGGVYTGYMRDAFGSVTGTTDSSGNLENTYRWAGYGTQISKSGTAADPKFLWAGALGCRQTGRLHAGTYSRRRHYGVEQAGWTSIDGLWPRLSPYAYARRRPHMLADPSGLLPEVCRKLAPPAPPQDPTNPIVGDCGAITVWWDLSVTESYTGWIIQQLTNTAKITCCLTMKLTNPPSGCGVSGSGNIFAGTYYEAFWVQSGVVYVPDSSGSVFEGGILWGPPASNGECYGCDDVWDFASFFVQSNTCSFGYATKEGSFQVLGVGQALPGGFSAGNPACAGCAKSLPCSTGYSSFSGSQANAVLTAEWSCCTPTAGQSNPGILICPDTCSGGQGCANMGQTGYGLASAPCGQGS